MQNHVRPVVSFDLQEREEVPVQCEAVRRSIAAQLGASVRSYDGQARIHLDTNSVVVGGDESGR